MVVRYFCALIYLYLIDYYLSSLDDLALFQLFSIINAVRKVSYCPKHAKLRELRRVDIIYRLETCNDSTDSKRYCRGRSFGAVLRALMVSVRKSCVTQFVTTIS